MNIHKVLHALFIFLMGLYLFVGLHVFSDYGVSIDEYSQIDLGRVNLARLQGSMEIQYHYDRYYGPAFEMPLYLFSRTVAPCFGISEMDGRHLGVFLFFFVSLIPWYLLLSKLFKHPAYGLLGTLLLVLYPRFFAEAFYNTKDMVFTAETIWFMAALYALLSRNTRGWIALAGILGISIATRAQGLFLFGISGLVLFSEDRPLRKKLKTFALITAVTAAVTFVLFPVFWNNPLQNMIGFWKSSANEVGAPTWFMGTLRISPDLPWYYHDVWIAISSMLSVLTLTLAGTYYAVRNGIRNRWTAEYRSIAACLGIIFGTLFVSALFHPRSYDGWRHIYYVYPPMIVLSLYAVSELIKLSKNIAGHLLLIGIGLFLATDIVASLFFIITTHPNEHVYFNPLVGTYTTAKKQFDFDYWGISQKQLLGYLQTISANAGTRVWFDQKLPYTTAVLIPALEARGMSVVENPDDADILILINRDFRYVPSSQFRKAFAVTVFGADLSAVYVKPVHQYPGK